MSQSCTAALFAFGNLEHLPTLCVRLFSAKIRGSPEPRTPIPNISSQSGSGIFPVSLLLWVILILLLSPTSLQKPTLKSEPSVLGLAMACPIPIILEHPFCEVSIQLTSSPNATTGTITKPIRLDFTCTPDFHSTTPQQPPPRRVDMLSPKP